MRTPFLLVFVAFYSGSVLADNGLDLDKGYFWHVSDFHYDDTYGNEGQSCRLPVPNPGPFGNGTCDAPWRLVEDAMVAMATIKQDVDFILWTGDNAGHIRTQEFSAKRNLYMIQRVTSAMNRMFPDTTVVPSFGNHDFFPADYTNGTERKFYDTVCQMWAPWIHDPKQIETCRGGGFYSRLVGPKLRVVAANTILYLIENPKSKNLTDPSSQFPWLEATLAEARLAGEKVIMSAHVAPTISAPGVFNWYYPQYQDRFVKLMTRFSDVIVAHHYGHEHSDTFKILQNEDESGATPVFLAPSVTPLRNMDPAGHQAPRHNPGIRLVQYDRQTGLNLGYRQFYTNITLDNSDGQSTWSELYSFQETFKVKDMSVTSLRKIFEGMSKPFSRSMLEYCNHFLVTTTPDTDCTLEDQAGFWCAAHMTNVDKAKECVKDYIHRFHKKARHWFCTRTGVQCKMDVRKV